MNNLRACATSVEKTALELCKDLYGDRIRFWIRQNGNIFIDTLDDEAYSCLFASLERNKPLIPEKNRRILEQILNTHKEKRNKAQSANLNLT